MPTTKSNASSAHTKLRAILREDADFASLHKNTLLSGSYKRDTAIRPRIKNGESNRPDVDILVLTKHSLFSSPVDAVDDVFDVLTRHYTPTNRPVAISLSLYRIGRYGCRAHHRAKQRWYILHP